AAGDRPHDIFDACPAIYRVSDRQGVSVVVVRTTDLAREQLVTLLRYRLAQYLSIGFVDPGLVLVNGWEHEPLEHVGDADLHGVAGNARTGGLLCFLPIHALPEAASQCTMRDRDRPLLPVEEIYGWGVFNRLQTLPELPLARVREFKRFVRNHA